MAKLRATRLLLAMLLIGGVGLGVVRSDHGSLEPPLAYAQSNEPHDPIEIRSDSDFLVPTNGVRSGSGTRQDPFIITGWEIQTPAGSTVLPSQGTGILISGTTAFVEVRNCSVSITLPSHTGIRAVDARHVTVKSTQVSGLGEAIRFDRVIDAAVENVSVSVKARGINVYDSQEITIRNNTAIANHGTGIFVTTSKGLMIMGNRALNNSLAEESALDQKTYRADGINVAKSGDVRIEFNHASGNTGAGISFSGSERVQVRNNTIGAAAWPTQLHGIQGGSTTAAIVADNRIETSEGAAVILGRLANATIGSTHIGGSPNSVRVGIQVQDSSELVLKENRIQEAYEAGISILRSDGIISRSNRVSTVDHQGMVLQETKSSRLERDVISDVDQVGVFVTKSQDIVLFGVEVSHALRRAAVLVGDSQSISLEGGNLSDSFMGIDFTRTHASRIANVSLVGGTSTEYSGLLLHGEQNIVVGNRVADGRGYGIYISGDSRENVVRDNVAVNNSGGNYKSGAPASANHVFENDFGGDPINGTPSGGVLMTIFGILGGVVVGGWRRAPRRQR